MILRPATLEDARLLYEWRNHPSTRAMMHVTDEFDFASHCQWLADVLQAPRRQLLIAEVDGVPVGTVRADPIEGATEFSWTIAPEHRGCGYGRQMVQLALAQVSGEVRIEIKRDNTPSIRIALGAGLAPVREVDGVLHFRRSCTSR